MHPRPQIRSYDSTPSRSDARAMLENWDEAEESFRRVLAIEPGSSKAVQQLAFVQQKKLARIRG